MRHFLILFCGTVLFFGACTRDQPEPEVEASESPVIESLPFQQIQLNALENFQPVAANWSVAGRVYSDHSVDGNMEVEPGTGILVNQPSDGAKGNLFTLLEHGDLELQLDFMMPKGSNSGIYFQSRYEIQLFDSWMVAEPKHSDVGGIYERWKEDAPEGQQGYEGHAPAKNMAKAPGLWQHLHVIFRAPQFGPDGQKILDAKFEKVWLNGTLIHENVALTGPTRASAAEDEVAVAPLMIQGDHGPVAFQNVRFKKNFKQGLAIADLEYQYFELEGPMNQIPNFDTLQAVTSGKTDSFNLKLAKANDRFAFKFTGKLQVPKSGDYIFYTMSDDGSKLYLDGNLLVDNDFNHGFDRKSGLVTLNEGEHDFRLEYYNNTWGKGLAVLYEGPDMQYQPLLSKLPENSNRQPAPLLIEAAQRIELLRCFLNYGDEKRTHVMAVGNPGGVHYAVDLRQGTLLNFWRGPFADVSRMWVERGEPQLLVPQNLAIEGSDGPLAAILENANDPYPDKAQTGLLLDRYELDDNGAPAFFYKLHNAMVSDRYEVDATTQTLSRNVSILSNPDQSAIYFRLAKGDYIQQLKNGLYTIGGQYYIKIVAADAEPIIREQSGSMELIFVPEKNSNLGSIKFSLLW